MDEICVHGLTLQCIVGIHPHERVTEQPLRLDLTLGLDTREAARTGKISRTIHYGEVAEQVAALLRFRRYRLLEGAAEEVAWMLLSIYPRLERVKLRVEKPRALDGLAKAASLTIVRTREQFRDEQAPQPPLPSSNSDVTTAFGLVTREAELAVVTLAPNQPLLLGGPPSRRLLWVLGGLVHVDERLLSTGQHSWEDGRQRWTAITAGHETARVFFCHTQVDVT
jgi:dihydroneopterin aldolase